MKQGYLSEYFEGVAAKYLSAVEADETRSNQHEYNATRQMLSFVGRPSERNQIPARFLYFIDDYPDPIVEDAFLTLYDSRKNQPHRSAEYRFYFPTTNVSLKAAEGDLLVIAKCRDGGLLVIIVENGSSIARQIEWLFGFSDLRHPSFSVKSKLETEQYRIGFAARVVLEQIGIEIDEQAPNYLDQMLSKFKGAFPKTIDFSAYARSTIPNLSSLDDPDVALLKWMEREEILFRTLEKHLLGEKLRNLIKDGDVDDTDKFIKLIQSVLQRRKSRAGSALENHLEQIFIDNGITYSRTAITENNLKPDFIFPNISSYRDNVFPQAKLAMLASKSTCKDRWRQIINEAARIPIKHLLTLEPSISENQTNEMKAEQVQLVLPCELHTTYTHNQQAWLIDVKGFIQLVRNRQN